MIGSGSQREVSLGFQALWIPLGQLRSLTCCNAGVGLQQGAQAQRHSGKPLRELAHTIAKTSGLSHGHRPARIHHGHPLSDWYQRLAYRLQTRYQSHCRWSAAGLALGAGG